MKVNKSRIITNPFNEISKGQLVELTMWEQVRKDCKYPKEDNNNGLIYGLYLLDEVDENWCGDIIDVEWFETDEERFKVIKENNLKIINQN